MSHNTKHTMPLRHLRGQLAGDLMLGATPRIEEEDGDDSDLSRSVSPASAMSVPQGATSTTTPGVTSPSPNHAALSHRAITERDSPRSTTDSIVVQFGGDAEEPQAEPSSGDGDSHSSGSGEDASALPAAAATATVSATAPTATLSKSHSAAAATASTPTPTATTTTASLRKGTTVVRRHKMSSLAVNSTLANELEDSSDTLSLPSPAVAGLFPHQLPVGGVTGSAIPIAKSIRARQAAHSLLKTGSGRQLLGSVRIDGPAMSRVDGARSLLAVTMAQDSDTQAGSSDVSGLYVYQEGDEMWDPNARPGAIMGAPILLSPASTKGTRSRRSSHFSRRSSRQSLARHMQPTASSSRRNSLLTASKSSPALLQPLQRAGSQQQALAADPQERRRKRHSRRRNLTVYPPGGGSSAIEGGVDLATIRLDGRSPSRSPASRSIASDATASTGDLDSHRASGSGSPPRQVVRAASWHVPSSHITQQQQQQQQRQRLQQGHNDWKSYQVRSRVADEGYNHNYLVRHHTDMEDVMSRPSFGSYMPHTVTGAGPGSYSPKPLRTSNWKSAPRCPMGARLTEARSFINDAQRRAKQTPGVGTHNPDRWHRRMERTPSCTFGSAPRAITPKSYERKLAARNGVGYLPRAPAQRAGAPEGGPAGSQGLEIVFLNSHKQPGQQQQHQQAGVAGAALAAPVGGQHKRRKRNVAPLQPGRTPRFIARAGLGAGMLVKPSEHR